MSDKSKKKETRIMKVTMDADEFEKFDKGETHSDKGIRNDRGTLSALPDIAPVSESDLPQRTVIRTRKVYVQPKEPTLGQMVKQEVKNAIADATYDAITDPRKRAIIVRRVKNLWGEHVKPLLKTEKKDEPKYRTKAEQLIDQRQQQQSEIAYQVETINDKQERIIVTGEQAAIIINAMRQKARELSAMIYLFSNICVKDEKTDSEYILEEAYIKQLLSEEATSTMRTLVAHRQLLDEGTVLCFEDWLSGYVRAGDQKVPIPARIECESAKEAVIDPHQEEI